MSISNCYKEFMEASQQSCGRLDPQRGAKMRRYREAKQALFEELKKAYQSGETTSERADHIMQVISESTQDPEAFWGSAKAAKSNQAIFVHEKNERLFEELLQIWSGGEGRG